MNVLKNLGLGAAMVTTSAMLMGTPVTPPKNIANTQTHVYSLSQEELDEIHLLSSRIPISYTYTLECSDSVIRYADTYLADRYYVFNAKRLNPYFNVSIDYRKAIGYNNGILVTDNIHNPTFLVGVYDMGEDHYKKLVGTYNKAGSSYYFHRDITSEGVYEDYYYYPSEGICVYNASYPNGDVLPDYYSLLNHTNEL